MEHDRAQLERVTFFSDAVFAIAMTLLVIEVRVPRIAVLSDRALAQALIDLTPQYIGFLTSFVVVGRFWVGHHHVMGMIRGLDRRLVWINLLFLLVVAFMPFPTAVFSDYVELRVGVGVYAGWLTVMGVFNRWLILTALADPALRRDGIEEADLRRTRRATLNPLLIGGLAFAVGMVAPLASLIVLILGTPLIGWAVRREWSSAVPRVTPG